MYSREPRYRGTHSQATPWTVGPSRLNDEVHPIAADAGLSLIAASAKDKVQGRTGAQQQTVFRGRVSAGSAPREVKQLDQYRLSAQAQARLDEHRLQHARDGHSLDRSDHLREGEAAPVGAMREQARALAADALGDVLGPGLSVDVAHMIQNTVHQAISVALDRRSAWMGFQPASLAARPPPCSLEQRPVRASCRLTARPFASRPASASSRLQGVCQHRALESTRHTTRIRLVRPAALAVILDLRTAAVAVVRGRARARLGCPSDTSVRRAR